MTVKELIEQLQQLPPDLQVILQKDEEGNGYKLLYRIDADSVCSIENNYDVEVIYPGYYENEEDWVEAQATMERCCVLIP